MTIKENGDVVSVFVNEPMLVKEPEVDVPLVEDVEDLEKAAV